MIDVNLRGVLYGIAAALPVFRARGFGHFVNTSSTAARRIVPNRSVYAATKTAVNVISRDATRCGRPPSPTRSSSRPASTSARSSSAPPRRDDSAPQDGELALAGSGSPSHRTARSVGRSLVGAPTSRARKPIHWRTAWLLATLIR